MTSALATDLYELTMAESYLREGIAEQPATFSVFVRHLPPGWGYLLAAGLDGVLGLLEGLRFTPRDLRFLRDTGLFGPGLADRLGRLRFTGSVRAVPEGTPLFPHEPLVEVTAPLVEAQLVEGAVLNALHLATLVASKASRCVQAAGGRGLIDFSLRRTHGIDAAVQVARSSWIAGFDSTSDVLAGSILGMPLAGTMAHSYVQAFPDEGAAFRAFARAFPQSCVLLVDTYDTEAGLRRAAGVGREMAARGEHLAGVRLDSGDMDALSRRARAILDQAGLAGAGVVASGGLDEHAISRLVGAGAPVSAFGVGGRLGTSADAPVLDMAYKMVAVGGRPVLKLSSGKATLPGPKQVFRAMREGRIAADVLGLADEEPPAGTVPLLATVMEDGRRLAPEPLSAVRDRGRQAPALLSDAQTGLDARALAVEPSAGLRALAARVEREVRVVHGLPA